MKEEKNKEEKKFKISDIINNKRYYAISYLTFYGIIIIALIIMVRVSPSADTNNNTNINTSSDIESKTKFQGYENIKNKNFNFIYTIESPDNKFVIKGKQYNDKILFVDSRDNREYYSEGNIVLVKENDNYILSKYSFDYFNYEDVDLIEKLLLSSNIDDDEYIIGLPKFLEIIGEELESNDPNDSIVIIVTKSNKTITKIEFDLSDYAKLKNKDNKKLKLTLEYSDFRLIEDFNIQQ